MPFNFAYHRAYRVSKAYPSRLLAEMVENPDMFVWGEHHTGQAELVDAEAKLWEEVRELDEASKGSTENLTRFLNEAGDVYNVLRYIHGLYAYPDNLHPSTADYDSNVLLEHLSHGDLSDPHVFRLMCTALMTEVWGAGYQPKQLREVAHERLQQKGKFEGWFVDIVAVHQSNKWGEYYANQGCEAVDTSTLNIDTALTPSQLRRTKAA